VGYQPLDFQLIGSPNWQPQSMPIWEAPAFNGVSDYGLTTGSIDLTTTTVLTLVFWAYWNVFADDDATLIEASVNQNSNTDSIRIGLNTSAAGGGMASASVKTPAAINRWAFPRPSPQTWHHYLITFDRGGGSQQIRGVWVDGIAQPLTSQATSGTTGTFGNFPWYVMSRGGTTLFGAGRLGDMWIYRRLLGETEAMRFTMGQTPLTLNRITLFAGGAASPTTTSTAYPFRQQVWRRWRY
jgi:hypothetical protein